MYNKLKLGEFKENVVVKLKKKQLEIDSIHSIDSFIHSTEKIIDSIHSTEKIVFGIDSLD